MSDRHTVADSQASVVAAGQSELEADAVVRDLDFSSLQLSDDEVAAVLVERMSSRMSDCPLHCPVVREAFVEDPSRDEQVVRTAAYSACS